MKTGTVIAWVFIVLVAIGLPILGALPEEKKAPTTRPGESLVALQTQFMAKYAIGVVSLAREQAAPMQQQIDSSVKTDVDRIVAGMVAAETLGAEDAVRRLSAVDSPDAAALALWYRSKSPPPEGLFERYGYAGRLAATFGLPDSDPARADLLRSGQVTMFGVLGVAGAVLVAALVGVVLLIVGIVLLSTGKLRLAPVGPMPGAGWYVQGFALYLGVFLLGSVLISLLAGDLPITAALIPLSAAVAVGIAYPLVRGVSASELRRDWGLHTGKGVIWETMSGILGYLAGLPLIAVGIGLTVVLSMVFGANVSHPISDEFARHKLAIVLLAVVFAPVTEEILFRGGFLAHCRTFAGPVVSGLIVGVVFAAIHPQGWAGIPALASIGFVMAMIRAWRGSIIGPIVAHALNNGTVVCLMLLMV